MKWAAIDPLKRCYAVTAAILVVGWGIALPIYFLSPPDDPDPLASLEYSKRYLAQLERIGGKAAVLSNQLSEGFANLWHGAELGVTLAVLTASVAFVYCFVTRENLKHESRE